jgi:glycosyltransferase involved in cell wall biosynthesis
MKHANISDCSLLVATYDWPQALNKCLKSIKKQSVLPNEVIIADDGSKDETRLLIDEIKKTFPVKIIHIWQPDEGFQLAKIRNKAFAVANYPYIIQIDGDLILHTHFVKDHLSLAKKQHFITGSRAILKEETTKAILLNSNTTHLDVFSGKGSNFLNGLRIGFVRRFLARRYKVEGKNRFYVKGCNMSFWRKDVIAVNGYNEAFKGWGREDSELAIRLINAGINKQFIKTGGICYHLHHKEASRELEQRNLKMMKDAIINKTTWIKKGLSQYLQNPDGFKIM